MSTHCAECGAALDEPGTFHPHLLCVIKEAWPDYDPWEVFTEEVAKLGIVGLPERAPLVRDLPLDGVSTRQEQER